MKLVFTSALALALAGCATEPSYMASASKMADKGDCDGAIQEIKERASNPGDRAVGIGAVYEVCKKDIKTAISYYTLGARYGQIGARERLALFNAPVPSADLAKVESYVQPQIVRQNPSAISCTSSQIGFGGLIGKTTTTTCN